MLGLPGLPGLPDRVTLLTGVKFCHVNFSRRGNPPSRGRILDTSNSRKIYFGGGFASFLKATKESHSTIAAKAVCECRRALVAKTRVLPAFFCLRA